LACVEGVRFATHPALGTVDAADFKHAHTGSRQHAGKFRAVGTCAFDTNGFDDAVRVEEVDDLAVSTAHCEELPVGDRPPEAVDDGDMMGVFVGVDPGEDGAWRCGPGGASRRVKNCNCHWIRSRFFVEGISPLGREGRRHRGETGGQAPIKSCRPEQAALATPVRRTDPLKDNLEEVSVEFGVTPHQSHIQYLCGVSRHRAGQLI
jgi:hypothetical protein